MQLRKINWILDAEPIIFWLELRIDSNAFMAKGQAAFEAIIIRIVSCPVITAVRTNCYVYLSFSFFMGLFKLLYSSEIAFQSHHWMAIKAKLNI